MKLKLKHKYVRLANIANFVYVRKKTRIKIIFGNVFKF